MAWIKSHWMSFFLLLKHIPMDSYKEQFSNYGRYSKKNVNDIILGIWLWTILFASL